MKALRWLAPVLAVLFLCAGLASRTTNAQTTHPGHRNRVALVVGNDRYRSVSPLEKAAADATSIAERLQAVGFRVTLKTNVDLAEFKRSIRAFKAEVSGGDEVIFYFAGHGVQLGSANYLLPVDVSGNTEDQVRDDALPLQRVLDDIEDRRARFTLAIVDACRNNPFKLGGRAVAARGLGPTAPATGQMVIYSAGAGQLAADRLNDKDSNPHSLFTRVFLEEMTQPGVSVDRIVRNVRERVVRLAKAEGYDQVPAIYDQTVGDFYLIPPPAGTAVTKVPVPAPGKPAIAVAEPQATAPPASDRARAAAGAAAGPDSIEDAYWAEVQRGGTPRHFEAYLKEFPDGKHAAQAREAMKSPNRAGLTRAMREEDAAWAKAQLVGTAEAYAAYRQSYPLGRYIPLAKLRMMDLERARPQSIRDCPECPEMVIVPAGSFDMGSPENEDGREAFESPRHRVSIASFAAGKYEVTFDEWDACVRASGCREITEDGGWGRGRRPVRKVTWNAAREYVGWLSQRTGKRYRLLSEAEWEYVARAGSGARFPNGRFVGPSFANCAGCGGATDVHEPLPVGSFKPNAFGLHDTAGNVWEWVEDCWHESYDSAPSDGSPWVGGDCARHVTRGGAFDSGPRAVRPAKRNRVAATKSHQHLGFRVARTLP